MNTYRKLPLSIKVILLIQSVAMLMGTSTHVTWAIQNGFLSERYNAPFLYMLFWDSLTFLDPLAAILLFIWPKTGLLLTLLIIVMDVIHNNWYYFDELYRRGLSFSEWVEEYWMIFGQMIFALFVLLTFRRCLSAINSSTSSNLKKIIDRKQF
jgi:hypothetical protein